MFLFFGGGVFTILKVLLDCNSSTFLVEIGFLIDQVAADMKVLHLTVSFSLGGWVASNDFEGSAG
jgi:GH18 family chitinase